MVGSPSIPVIDLPPDPADPVAASADLEQGGTSPMSSISSRPFDASPGASTVASASQRPDLRLAAVAARSGGAVSRAARTADGEQLKMKRFYSMNFYMLIVGHHLWFTTPLLFVFPPARDRALFDPYYWTFLFASLFVAAAHFFAMRVTKAVRVALSGRPVTSLPLNWRGRLFAAHAFCAILATAYIHFAVWAPMPQEAGFSGMGVHLVILVVLVALGLASAGAQYTQLAVPILQWNSRSSEEAPLVSAFNMVWGEATAGNGVLFLVELVGFAVGYTAALFS
ncbi:unnamed protein product [Vitrella brassicaformis CCMP3155]|uniref:Uncharacterized protein n=1 Tax=Vitrella brassicaformis (strain CCMP3155) TaxID=1169540 RepID=A0A0G4FSG5_VITBC|nr:unnamed protein product [Vitrella brassicaformis CCMP3155]|eukprot:CEM17361.1 unnamed protein product [Vitrella brassicaformis CCMP3155]